MATPKSKYSVQIKKPGKTKAFFICLLIAMFLWTVHSLNRIYTYSFKIPVEFINIPANKRPLIQLPEVINVEVKASGLKLALIQMNELNRKFIIDFNLIKSSNREQNYILSTSDLKLKRWIKFETQIKSISPDTLYFVEKTGYQKLVPVKVPLFIKCKEGYGFSSPLIEPAFLTIWGDSNAIDQTDTLYTQSLNLNSLSQSTQTILKLIKPNSEVHTTQNEISVSLNVKRLIQETIILPIQSVKELSQQQVRLFPSRVKVTFTSLQNSFNLADTLQFKAFINPDKIKPKTNKCSVFIENTPTNVTVLDIEPKEVEILILKK